MSIASGQTGLASDFVSSASGSGDSGKVAKLNSAGQQNRAFITAAFGGTGADGALSISSGTTTISAASAAVLIKNYTSISITGTGKLAFSTPNTNGTIIILKSQGNVTLTSSQAPMIDASAMGAAGGAAQSTGPGSGTNGFDGNDGLGFALLKTNKGTGGVTAGPDGTAGAIAAFNTSTVTPTIYTFKYPFAIPGGGGGAGATNGGAATTQNGGGGGNGGGGLIMECAGAWNFTTTGGISVAGASGTNGSQTGGSNGTAAGGGAGAGGTFIAFYNTLTANSGTVTISGGSVGTSAGASPHVGGGGGSLRAAGSGGNGATGYSIIAANTEMV